MLVDACKGVASQHGDHGLACIPKSLHQCPRYRFIGLKNQPLAAVCIVLENAVLHPARVPEPVVHVRLGHGTNCGTGLNGGGFARLDPVARMLKRVGWQRYSLAWTRVQLAEIDRYADGPQATDDCPQKNLIVYRFVGVPHGGQDALGRSITVLPHTGTENVAGPDFEKYPIGVLQQRFYAVGK